MVKKKLIVRNWTFSRFSDWSCSFSRTRSDESNDINIVLSDSTNLKIFRFIGRTSEWRIFSDVGGQISKIFCSFFDSREPGAVNFRPIEVPVNRQTRGQSQPVQWDFEKSRTIILNVIRNTYTHWIIYIKSFWNNWWFPMFPNLTERVDFDHMFAGQLDVRLAWNLPRPVLLSQRIDW